MAGKDISNIFGIYLRQYLSADKYTNINTTGSTDAEIKPFEKVQPLVSLTTHDFPPTSLSP